MNDLQNRPHANHADRAIWALRTTKAELAASMALDDAGMMLAHARGGDGESAERAMIHAQRVVEHIAAMCGAFRVDLLEVLPTKTCSACSRESVECRSYPDEPYTGKVLCATCAEQRLTTPGEDIERDPDCVPFADRETLRQLPAEPELMTSEAETWRAKYQQLAARHRAAIGLLTDIERPASLLRAFLSEEVSR